MRQPRTEQPVTSAPLAQLSLANSERLIYVNLARHRTHLGYTDQTLVLHSPPRSAFTTWRSYTPPAFSILLFLILILVSFSPPVPSTSPALHFVRTTTVLRGSRSAAAAHIYRSPYTSMTNQYSPNQ